MWLSMIGSDVAFGRCAPSTASAATVAAIALTNCRRVTPDVMCVSRPREWLMANGKNRRVSTIVHLAICHQAGIFSNLLGFGRLEFDRVERLGLSVEVLLARGNLV